MVLVKFYCDIITSGLSTLRSIPSLINFVPFSGTKKKEGQ